MTAEDASTNIEEELSALRSHNAHLETSLRQVRQDAERRLIDVELRSEAAKSGIIDLDGLRLLDHLDVAVDSDGNVRGAQAAIARLRREKPWLFGAPNSSSAAGVPPSTVSRPKLATEMTLSEWREARAELLRRR